MITLTPREAEIIELIRENPARSRKELAELLGIRVTSLNAAIQKIYNKAGCNNLIQLLNILDEDGFKIFDNTGSPRLTPEEVERIRELAKTVSRNDLATRFNVFRSTIDNYLRNTAIS